MLEKHLTRLNQANSDFHRAMQSTSLSSTVQHSLFKSGRFSRRPNYKNWTVKGTRPSSDRGVTFHFKHTFVTKGRHVSKSYKDLTSASAHQAYIERNGAVEALGKNAKDPEDVDLISFGTTGNTKTERQDFWRSVERTERYRGRVQNRIIAELPHELSSYEREKIARDFCDIFEQKSLPYWCCIHAPSGHNDPRNFHMHIAYYDRPSRKMKDGQWDFEAAKTVKLTNRMTRLTYPYRQNKDREVSDNGWVKYLRRNFSDIANFHLALAEKDKRYDPRSYLDSGIDKVPTVHLGNKAFIAEIYGLDTILGSRNTEREVSFRLRSSKKNYREEISHIENIMDRLSPKAQDTVKIQQLKRDAREIALAHKNLSEEGIEVEQKREIHQLAIEATSLRPENRSTFLNTQIDRLYYNPPSDKEGHSWELAGQLEREIYLLGEAREDLSPFIKKCEKVVSLQTRRSRAIQHDQADLLSEIFEIEKEVISLSEPVSSVDIKEKSYQTQMAYELAFGVTSITENYNSGEDETDPELIAMRKIAGKKKQGRSEAAIPNAIEYLYEISPNGISNFEKEIRPLSNKELRSKIISTRDACDFTPDEMKAKRFQAAHLIMVNIAERRGLDITTGVHRPERAKDPKMAFEHTDSELNPVKTSNWQSEKVR